MASFAEKNANFMKIVAHEEADYVPTMANSGPAPLAWAGKKAMDVWYDLPAYVDAMTKVFGEMWTDCVYTLGYVNNVDLGDYFGDYLENRLGPDGITEEHVQKALMQKDEYDQLIRDPNAFMANVILPRKYPKLFEDREWAKTGLQRFASSMGYIFGAMIPALMEKMAKDYGATPIMDGMRRLENPIDMLFDYFRGFRGTLTDLRRQPDNVRAAVDRIWEARCVPFMENAPRTAFPYACQMTHLAPYLSPKQFYEFYWPYEKKLLEWVADMGSKTTIILEGKWENFYECFLEVPKDSCILMIDDDDVIKAKQKLGHHQIIAGGIHLSKTRMGKAETIMDEVKQVLDACAPGGGFILTTDKCLISPGDINQTLIDVYNAAHEYGKY